jgi:hypothetical protein
MVLILPSATNLFERQWPISRKGIQERSNPYHYPPVLTASVLLRYRHALSPRSIAFAAPTPQAMAAAPAVLASDAGDSGAAIRERNDLVLALAAMGESL